MENSSFLGVPILKHIRVLGYKTFFLSNTIRWMYVLGKGKHLIAEFIGLVCLHNQENMVHWLWVIIQNGYQLRSNIFFRKCLTVDFSTCIFAMLTYYWQYTLMIVRCNDLSLQN